MDYMVQDRRTGNWLYKRQWPDKKWCVRSLGSPRKEEAFKRWPKVHDEFEQERIKRRAEARYRFAKDAKRVKMWTAIARFLRAQKAANGGSLPLPPRVEHPTTTRLTSHPFIFVRSNFLAWAQHNDPEAATVFGMGDEVEDMLFHAGVVAAYFTVIEMDRLADDSQRTSGRSVT